jgi:hypothetical protein
MSYQQHFYDEQIKRFIVQVIRALSNFQVRFGDGTLYRVPVTYGDSSRQAQSIISRNSENSIPSCPLISIYITDLKYDRTRIQDPTFIDRISVRTRAYDACADSYLNQQGNAYNIERQMPVPYELTVKADIWTSNSDQKFQLLEQILVLFNPALEIQSTDNYIDWTSLSYMEITDSTWSSRSIPQGTDDQIDISSVSFKIPIWLTAPARVRKMGVIHKVVAGIFNPTGDLADFVASDDLLLGTRQGITFQNYGIWVNDGEVQLLKANPVKNLPSSTDIGAEVVVGTSKDWPAALDKYGVIRNGISQLRLIITEEVEIVGTIALNPLDDKVLLFTVDPDTIPVNTLTAVNAIIDPTRVHPGYNGLPAAAAGQRYLLLNGTGSNDDNQAPSGWEFNGYETIANANDIIQYDGTRWAVSFDSQANTSTQYVSNLTTGRQYKYSQGIWTKSWEGEYHPLHWRLIL